VLSLVLRRALRAVLTAAGIAILAFLVLHARSEEALLVLAESRGVRGEEALAALRSAHGLDRPLLVRLGSWIGAVAEGRMGDSWSHPGSSVARVLLDHLPLTVALTGSGLLLQLVLGLGVAAASVRNRGTWKDALLNVLALGINALPEFCVGFLLLWPFAVRLGWFPLSGALAAPWEAEGGLFTTLLDGVHHLALPALCLGLASFAAVARLLCLRWEDEMGTKYVVGAKARGIPHARIVWGHGLRNAAGPLCTSVGLSLPGLVGGAVVVEQVFNWPGMGRVLLDAIAARDLNLIAGANLLLALLVTLGGALSDLLFAALDPRVRRR